jgi:hypothetical protein
MSNTLTATEILSDGINIALVGRTRAECAYARAEFVELAREVEASLENVGEITDSTPRVIADAITSQCMALDLYTRGIDTIDRLPR